MSINSNYIQCLIDRHNIRDLLGNEAYNNFDAEFSNAIYGTDEKLKGLQKICQKQKSEIRIAYEKARGQYFNPYSMAMEIAQQKHLTREEGDATPPDQQAYDAEIKPYYDEYMRRIGPDEARFQAETLSASYALESELIKIKKSIKEIKIRLLIKYLFSELEKIGEKNA